MNDIEKKFDHKKAGISDKIALLSELEHGRAHALRSAVSLYNPDNKDDTRWASYALKAKTFQEIRRKYQAKHFSELSEYDWCLCKVASRIRQLGYEVFEDDIEELKEIDDLVDEIWGDALGVDLSSCEACRSDKEN